MFEFLADTWWLWIVITILAAVVIYNDPKEVEKRQENRKKKAELREYKWKLQDEYKEERTILDISHLAGLPLPQEAKCELWLCENSLVVFYGTPFVLDYSKITNVDFSSTTEFRKTYVDNASGAIFGGLAFGPIGALIGGGTKEIKSSETYYFLTITYKSKNTLKYLVFGVESYNKSGVKSFSKELLNKTQISDRQAIIL